MNPQIGIADKDRAAVAGILNRILADESLLLVKTKNYHWNVTGPNFGELHKLFDEQYEKVSEFTDEVAERVRSLGARPLGSLAAFLKNASLREAPASPPKAPDMIRGLLADHEALARSLRRGLEDCADRFHDMGTSDFLTGLMEEHEKMAWMLRAYQN